MTNNSMGVDSDNAGHPMDFLLSTELNLPIAGQIRQGWVVKHQNNAILVDIGAKSEGIITGYELDVMDAQTREILAVGNQVHICIVDPEDENGNLILSYAQAAEEQDWQNAAELLKNGNPCQGKIIGFNRGGVLIKVGQIRGFVPNSQLRRGRFHQPNNEANLQQLIGETIQAKVIEVDRKQNRFILSERAADEESRQAKRVELLAKLKEGDIYEGRVVNLANFGVFVDIGGIEGLVHLSELSWKRVNNPAEELQLGDQVKVSILNIDHDRQRLALSIKRLQPDPWTLLDKRYHIGQLVEATITKITKFGAFARLNDEYELIGLIHISELSEEHVTHPHEVVKPSQPVTVRIIRMDSEQHQLGLSLKQVASGKFLEADMEILATAG